MWGLTVHSTSPSRSRLRNVSVSTLRNPGDGPLEVVEPTRPHFEQNDDQNAPFVADTAQDFGHPIAVFGEAVFSILNHTSVPPVSMTCLLAAPHRMTILLRLLIN